MPRLHPLCAVLLAVLASAGLARAATPPTPAATPAAAPHAARPAPHAASHTARAAHPASARTGNLLDNPGFETVLAGHPWMPAGWDTSDSGLPTVYFGRDTFVVHSGHYGVNVANTSTSFPVWHNWNQAVMVGPDA